MVAAVANIAAGMVVATLTNAWSWCPVRSLLLHRLAWFADHDWVGTRGGTAAGPTESIRRATERKWVICRRANHPFACPAPFAKIFLFSSDANHFSVLRHPVPTRGAFRDRHERWARDAMDAGGALTKALSLRTAKSCGPDAPTLASSFAEVSAR
jgi:hypothetical protein